MNAVAPAQRLFDNFQIDAPLPISSNDYMCHEDENASDQQGIVREQRCETILSRKRALTFALGRVRL